MEVTDSPSLFSIIHKPPQVTYPVPSWCAHWSPCTLVHGPSGSFLKSDLWTTPCRTQCVENTVKCWKILSNVRFEFLITYAGNFGGLAGSCCCEPFSNFPSENSWIFSFALNDCRDDTGGEKPWSAPSDGLWHQESCATVAAQDLAYAPTGHLKDAVVDASRCFIYCNWPVETISQQDDLANFSHQNLIESELCRLPKKGCAYPKYLGYLAWSDSLRGQFNHFPPLGFWERSAVEKHPS